MESRLENKIAGQELDVSSSGAFPPSIPEMNGPKIVPEKPVDRIVRVDFYHFKAFDRFTLHIGDFNILVGPNNAGKSTILASFRILAAGIRKARARNPEGIIGPRGKTLGYHIELESISVAEENLFHNHDDTDPAWVKFTLSTGNILQLYFPANRVCKLIANATGSLIKSTTSFKKEFNCTIGFVPILGPVEHDEQLYQNEAARLSLFNYRAARNFRNIWYHYPERFPQFRELLRSTWPGMDIERPQVTYREDGTRLHMFCPEGRIPREIFWAGFGFQVWCQMLTHIVHSQECSLFLIDEPDIYLHADLQRQLVGILRNLGPDIAIATHSSEIIMEAEPHEVVLIDKHRSSAKRLKRAAELLDLLLLLGSNLNPALTQMAKTRKVLFVEGKDFNVIARFARKLNFHRVADRSQFAVIQTEGFNPDRIHNITKGIEAALGCRIDYAVVMDRDYRCGEECDTIAKEIQTGARFCHIHHRKELENFTLVPDAIQRSATKRLADKLQRNGKRDIAAINASEILSEIVEKKKAKVFSRILSSWKEYRKSAERNISDETHIERIHTEFERLWADQNTRYSFAPGKEVISELNTRLQEICGISLSAGSIIDTMHASDIPDEMRILVEKLHSFAEDMPSTRDDQSGEEEQP